MALGGLQNEADLERWLKQRFPALTEQAGSSVLLWGAGAPSVAPSAPRAIWVRLDGAAGSTVYVWQGAAWSAIA